MMIWLFFFMLVGEAVLDTQFQEGFRMVVHLHVGVVVTAFAQTTIEGDGDADA